MIEEEEVQYVPQSGDDDYNENDYYTDTSKFNTLNQVTPKSPID